MELPSTSKPTSIARFSKLNFFMAHLQCASIIRERSRIVKGIMQADDSLTCDACTDTLQAQP